MGDPTRLGKAIRGSVAEASEETGIRIDAGDAEQFAVDLEKRINSCVARAVMEATCPRRLIEANDAE